MGYGSVSFLLCQKGYPRRHIVRWGFPTNASNCLYYLQNLGAMGYTALEDYKKSPTNVFANHWGFLFLVVKG